MVTLRQRYVDTYEKILWEAIQRTVKRGYLGGIHAEVRDERRLELGYRILCGG